MSKSEGASPANSIFLHYPFDLEIVPPVKALQSRHWSVVIACFVTTIVFCGITPLSGAVFEYRIVTHSATAIDTPTASLLPLAEQSSSLNRGFMMNAYSTLWLDQKLPSFTTQDAAFVPFEIGQQTRSAFLQSSWTAQTTMYSSSLDCQPALVGNNSDGVTYDNGKGCVVEDFDIDKTIPNSTSLFSSYYKPSCNGETSSQPFLVFSFKNAKPAQGSKLLGLKGTYTTPNPKYHPWASYWEKTVIFCEPSYTVQSVNATLATPNMTISDFKPLAPPRQLLSSAFNIFNFESIVASSSPDQNVLLQPNTDQLKGDINETTQNISTTQLEIRGITDVFDNMIVFAVGSSQLAADAYLNASVLAISLDSAYKVLFALALNSLFSTSTSTSNSTSYRATGTIRGDTNAIAVVRTLAIVLEACLGLAASLALLLLLICWNRRIELRKDPASLSCVLEIIQNDPKIRTIIEKLGQKSGGPNLTLRNGGLHVDSCKRKRPMPSTNLRSPTAGFGKDHHDKPVLPFVMKYAAGSVFLGVLIAVLILVVVLRLCIRHLNGLDVPSNNPILAQIILNYVPVLFATLLEPFWTLLNRKLCVSKPFEALRGGKAKGSQSMDLRYTSLPPQLAIWRALKARHLLLVAVCATGLSSNILAVTMNALLQPRLTAIASGGAFLKSFSPVVNQIPWEPSSSDHLYIAAANFSHGASLPAWVSRELYFLPFQINTTSPSGGVQSYTANTPGFGLNVVCTNQTWEDPAYIALPNNEIGEPRFSVNQNSVYCTRQWSTYYDSHSKTNASLEILAPLGPSFANASQAEHDVCGSTLAMGSLRAELYAEIEDVDSLFTSFTWMTCESTLFTAIYEVEVTTSGRVEQYTRKSDISTNISFANSSSLASLLSNLFAAFDTPFNNENPHWNNDTTRDTWPGFLIKALTNSVKLIDPALPAPGFEAVAPVVIDLLTRLFPIILSLQPSAFVTAPHGSMIEGTMLVPCTRVFMSSSMFIATVILLLLNIAVAVAYYVRRPRPMPKAVLAETIAGVLELFNGSGLVEEQVKDKSWPEDWKFGYGGFIGVSDGKPKMGIERRPFVVPLGEKKGM
ncbi:MAG: hypothetical protein ASARMPREDX12_009584 [Alectoria sarmentosa]|nr:MAG: hypothetical protein ASARMPREDX12_009584 [Alectoria sarmentosa]